MKSKVLREQVAKHRRATPEDTCDDGIFGWITAPKLAGIAIAGLLAGSFFSEYESRHDDDKAMVMPQAPNRAGDPNDPACWFRVTDPTTVGTTIAKITEKTATPEEDVRLRIDFTNIGAISLEHTAVGSVVTLPADYCEALGIPTGTPR